MPHDIQFQVVEKYKDISPFFDGAYGPRKTSDNITKEEFHEECIAAYDAVQMELETLGECDAYANKDFSTGRDWPKYHVSRRIGIVVNTKKMMVPALILLIHNALRLLKYDYIATINGEIGRGEDFYIAVEKNGKVTGYAKDPKWLKSFGF